MPLKIKVDEDLPRQVASALREFNHDAVTVLEQSMGGWKDDVLWKVVQDEERYFVTADKGFGDLRAHPPGDHFGILLLRPDEDGIRPVLDLLRQVLRSYALDDLKGTLAVATPRGIRLRRK